MGLVERFGWHASESGLLAMVAGEPMTPHASACASCQARLAELRAWVDGTAAEAGAMADDAFTPERLAAQKQQVLARLQAAGRSARVIAFPFGVAAPARIGTRDLVRWAAAAAVGGIMVGLASGRLLDRHSAPSPAAVPGAASQTPPLSSIVASTAVPHGDLDEAALLDAAYDRISLESLQTIDDMTPRAREVALASNPRGPSTRR